MDKKGQKSAAENILGHFKGSFKHLKYNIISQFDVKPNKIKTCNFEFPVKKNYIKNIQ